MQALNHDSGRACTFRQKTWYSIILLFTPPEFTTVHHLANRAPETLASQSILDFHLLFRRVWKQLIGGEERALTSSLETTTEENEENGVKIYISINHPF